MMRSVPVFGLVVLLSCSDGNDFKKFSDKLPVFSAPIKFTNSGLIRHQYPQDHDPVLFSKFAPRGTDKVLGKMYEDGKTVSIIYVRSGDVDTPVMITYTAEGVKLDSLNLFYVASSNQGAEVKRLVTFSQEREIQTIDSILIWSEIFTEGEPDINQASRVQTLSIDTVVHAINTNGRIVRKN